MSESKTLPRRLTAGQSMGIALVLVLLVLAAVNLRLVLGARSYVPSASGPLDLHQPQPHEMLPPEAFVLGIVEAYAAKTRLPAQARLLGEQAAALVPILPRIRAYMAGDTRDGRDLQQLFDRVIYPEQRNAYQAAWTAALWVREDAAELSRRFEAIVRAQSLPREAP
ncbi:MAG: hypothetical protein FJX76_01125 [Armatimonadetes bacterium]|nr:hypothetical protein [Armatimonadota bacterium]